MSAARPAGLEIERRFIVRVQPALLRRTTPIELRQGYLTQRDLVTVRIRQEGAAWVLAIKAPAGGIARHEIELPVPEETGRQLMALAAGGTLEKQRHVCGRWEIDVYAGRFEGLVLAEVELDREDEPLPAVPEGLELRREITQEVGLTSRGLAALGVEEARALVTRVMA